MTWVVEEGEPFPPGLVARTDRWLVGAPKTGVALRRELDLREESQLVPEFVTPAEPEVGELRSRRRAALGVGGAQLLVLGAGIATARKGPDLFAEVIDELARRSDRHVGAWIGGERDPLFPHLLERARSSDGRLQVMDSVASLAPWIGAADVFLHTARFDSLPNVCLLAAAQGVPVVAFAGTGGLADALAPPSWACRSATFPLPATSWSSSTSPLPGARPVSVSAMPSCRPTWSVTLLRS